MLAPIRFLCAGIALRFSTSVALLASAALSSPIRTWYVLGRWGSRLNPMPLEALDWGSQSTNKVFAPSEASDAARLMAVVVLPTPPFWLVTAMTLPTIKKSSEKRLDRGDGKGNRIGRRKRSFHRKNCARLAWTAGSR